MNAIIEKRESESKKSEDRVCKITVWALFGTFNHKIPIDLDSGITVIHGANGIGKTIILRMIDEIFSGRSGTLRRVPYDEFIVEFESGDSISVRPSEREKESAFKNITYTILIDGVYHKTRRDGELDAATVKAASSRLSASWKYQGEGKWMDRRDGEVIGFDELADRYPGPEILEKKSWERDPVLEKFSKKCRIRLISTDRLHSSAVHPNLSRPSARRSRSTSQRYLSEFVWQDGTDEGLDNQSDRAIRMYSDDLRARVKTVLTEYGKLTESLDRSLVRRLIGLDKKHTEPEVLLSTFKSLDEKRRRLTDLGLLNEAEDIVGTGASDREVLELVSHTTDVFAVYVQDMQKKLALFDDLQAKLEILSGRADKRFQFKRLEFSPDDGFMFKLQNGNRVNASDLSSGEQHEIIMLYEMLFMGDQYDLILIDEPEISLHIEWQMEFLSDLEEVLKASKVDVLMATHSVAIARGAKLGLVSLDSPGAR